MFLAHFWSFLVVLGRPCVPGIEQDLLHAQPAKLSLWSIGSNVNTDGLSVLNVFVDHTE